MTARSAVSQFTAKSSLCSLGDDNANPFEPSRSDSLYDITPTLPKPNPAVLPASRQRYMASTIEGPEQEPSGGGDIRREKDIIAHKREHVLDEKEWTARHQRQRSSADRTLQSYDPEKAIYAAPPASAQPRFVANNVSLAIAHPDDPVSDLDGLQARNAIKILLYLSGPCVLLSFITTIWACFSLLLAILSLPLRLCTSRRLQLCHLLAPTLNLHLRCIYAQVFPRPANDDKIYCTPWLLAVHLVAPILSLGNAIAAWIVAVYWVLARIVGDPSGVDKKDDGVEAVLVLVRCWEGCLIKGVKSQ